MPPGVYTFEITGTAGDKSASIYFEMEVVGGCALAELMIDYDAIPDAEYVITDTEQFYNLNFVTTVPAGCPFGIDF